MGMQYINHVNTWLMFSFMLCCPLESSASTLFPAGCLIQPSSSFQSRISFRSIHIKVENCVAAIHPSPLWPHPSLCFFCQRTLVFRTHARVPFQDPFYSIHLFIDIHTRAEGRSTWERLSNLDPSVEISQFLGTLRALMTWCERGAFQIQDFSRPSMCSV